MPINNSDAHNSYPPFDFHTIFQLAQDSGALNLSAWKMDGHKTGLRMNHALGHIFSDFSTRNMPDGFTDAKVCSVPGLDSTRHDAFLTHSGSWAILKVLAGLRVTLGNEQKGSILFIHPPYFISRDYSKALGFNILEEETHFSNNFQIDHTNIEHQIRVAIESLYPIQAIFLTDPIYGLGKATPKGEIKKIQDICKKKNIFLIIDASPSGPRWQDIQDESKDDISYTGDMGHLAACSDHTIVVDSLGKKLLYTSQALPAEVGVAYGSKEIIDACKTIDYEQMTGLLEGIDFPETNPTIGPIRENYWSVHPIQRKLAMMVLSDGKEDSARDGFQPRTSLREAYRGIISEIFEERLKQIQDLAEGSPYEIIRPDMGYHVMAIRRDRTPASEVDTMAWERNMIRLGVFALPTIDMGWSYTDPFGFRISLLDEHIVENVAKAFSVEISKLEPFRQLADYWPQFAASLVHNTGEKWEAAMSKNDSASDIQITI